MNAFSAKLDRILSRTITEARALKKGKLLHASGKVIEFDHLQDRGTYYKIGIQPAKIKIENKRIGAIRDPGDIDFYTPPMWGPDPLRLKIYNARKSGANIPEGWLDQDENGYSKPIDGEYDAKRKASYFRKFKHVLTINKVNVKNISFE